LALKPLAQKRDGAQNTKKALEKKKKRLSVTLGLFFFG
jgi:hypothetical protein